MKRFFILASAAIVALASCAKTEVVYKDAPEQIAFKQITNVMTKADPEEPVYLSGTLGVFANRTGDENVDGDAYLENKEFTGSGTWTGNVYWPYDGNLNFTVYAPHNEDADYSNGNLILSGVRAADGLYYGAQRYLNTAKPAESAAVPVALNHVAAKILVNLNPASVYSVTALSLIGVNKEGDVTVAYASNGTVTSVTTDADATADATFVISDTDAITDGINLAPVYVLPGSQTSFSISFTQENGEHDVNYTKTISLTNGAPKWNAHTAYTYNITIAGPDQIKFTATVNDYTPQTPSTNLSEADFE